jgi:hypothetical protein
MTRDVMKGRRGERGCSSVEASRNRALEVTVGPDDFYNESSE